MSYPVSFLFLFDILLPAGLSHPPDSMLTLGQRRHIRRPDDGSRRWPNGFLTGGPTLAQRRQATKKKLLIVWHQPIRLSTNNFFSVNL